MGISRANRPGSPCQATPTLVIAATNDAAVPRYHFDMLVNGIPGAAGRLVDRADHALIWTHTRQLADIICAEWQ